VCFRLVDIRFLFTIFKEDASNGRQSSFLSHGLHILG
jgi:hypothetical protein